MNYFFLSLLKCAIVYFIVLFQVSQPFELVGMDLIGKVVKTNDNNQYIAVMIDYFTKWPEAYPLTSKSAADVAQCIIKFFYRFGAPKRILTDQGKEFVNEVCTKILLSELDWCGMQFF